MEARISEIVHDKFIEELNESAILVRFNSCNFNCKFCDKCHMLVNDEDFLYELKELRKDLKNEITNVKYIYLTGGESTLQRQAVLFLAKFAKENELKVAIRTNGTKPDIISALIKEELVDDVIFNLYSPLDEEVFNRVTKSATFFITENEIIGHIRQSLALLEKHNEKVSIVFKTKVIPNLVFRKEHFFSLAGIVSKYDNSFWDITPFLPEDVVDKTYSNVFSPTIDFVEGLKDSILKEYSGIRMLR